MTLKDHTLSTLFTICRLDPGKTNVRVEELSQPFIAETFQSRLRIATRSQSDRETNEGLLTPAVVERDFTDPPPTSLRHKQLQRTKLKALIRIFSSLNSS